MSDGQQPLAGGVGLGGKDQDKDKDMDKRRDGAQPPIVSAHKFWIGLLVVTVLAVGASFWLARGVETPKKAADAAAVVLLVTAVATGVERMLEMLWGIVDRKSAMGSWWPLTEVTDVIVAVQDQTNEALGPVVTAVAGNLDDARSTVDGAKDVTAEAEQAAKEIDARLKAAQKAIEHAQTKLNPGSSRFAAITRAGDDFTREALAITAKYQIYSEKLEEGINGVSDALTQAADIVGAFKDNPARRSMSLVLGITLGTLAAGALQLNVFSAILAADTPDYLDAALGVVVTGIVMGLGTNPTHEVISALQRRKAEATVDVAVGTKVVAVRSAAVPAPRGTEATANIRYRAFAETAAEPEAVPVVYVRSVVTEQRTRRIRNAG